MLAPAAVKEKLRQKLSVKQSASRSQTKLTGQTKESNRSSRCAQRKLVQQYVRERCLLLLKGERSVKVGQ
jgi:hypothetical protein